MLILILIIIIILIKMKNINKVINKLKFIILTTTTNNNNNAFHKHIFKKVIIQIHRVQIRMRTPSNASKKELKYLTA